jgi:hypothetical protein
MEKSDVLDRMNNVIGESLDDADCADCPYCIEEREAADILLAASSVIPSSVSPPTSPVRGPKIALPPPTVHLPGTPASRLQHSRSSDCPPSCPLSPVNRSLSPSRREPRGEIKSKILYYQELMKIADKIVSQLSFDLIDGINGVSNNKINYLKFLNSLKNHNFTNLKNFREIFAFIDITSDGVIDKRDWDKWREIRMEQIHGLQMKIS